MLLSALSFTIAAQAAHDCQPDHLSPEDLAIMASVRASCSVPGIGRC